MSDLRDRYLACWNETDPEIRADLLATTFAPTVTYVDPLVDVTGLDALGATVTAVQQQFPGFVFTPVGEVDAHHEVARFGWGLGPDGEEPLIVGFDVVATDGSGRIASVAGFLDRVPDEGQAA